MSQIAPGRAPVLRPSPPYHRRMEPSPPPRPPEQSAPYNAPTPPPWPPRQAPPPRRGLYVIVFAAILAAGALIAGAILIAGSGGGGESSTTAASQSAPTASATSTSQATCMAWRANRQAVTAIPDLPAGWDWNTPNIDRAIENRTGAITRTLDLFEPKITSDPADVATAAHTYVAARRTEVQHLLDHTYSGADHVSVDSAFAELDQLCGTGTEPR